MIVLRWAKDKINDFYLQMSISPLFFLTSTMPIKEQEHIELPCLTLRPIFMLQKIYMACFTFLSKSTILEKNMPRET